MAVTHLWYGKAFNSTFNKEADWDTDTVKSQLHTVTYAPNQDTHQYRSDLTNELAAAGGYTAGGVTISPLTALYTGGTNIYNLDSATDPTWNPATFTARYCVQMDTSPATDATRPLLSYVDFGADQSPSGVLFAVQWAAAGICQITVS